MNSENLFSSSNDRKENMQINRNSPVQFSLTYDQYLRLQHDLPKKYSLLEYKATKKGPSGASMKFSQDDNQNFSRVSGNLSNMDDLQGRSKRQKSKKMDRFLQNEVPQKGTKRNASQKLNLDQEMMQCFNILQQLKKHKSSYPFLQPVNPQIDGAYNYLDIIKELMDLGTVEENLKKGEYQTATQFHGDINKIWMNSYAYSEKTSPFYKLTIEVERYYKNLLANEGISKKDKGSVVVKQRVTGNSKETKEPKQSKKDMLLEKVQGKEQQAKNESEKRSASGETPMTTRMTFLMKNDSIKIKILITELLNFERNIQQTECQQISITTNEYVQIIKQVNGRYKISIFLSINLSTIPSNHLLTTALLIVSFIFDFRISQILEYSSLYFLASASNILALSIHSRLFFSESLSIIFI